MLKIKEMINAEEIYNKYHWSGNGDYDFVGIRVQEEEFELGEIAHVSKVWIDGVETEEELDGICVINIKDIKNASDYFGDHAAIICGDEALCGDDYGELIISDPVVVEIIA